jgi:hypothetical protein
MTMEILSHPTTVHAMRIGGVFCCNKIGKQPLHICRRPIEKKRNIRGRPTIKNQFLRSTLVFFNDCSEDKICVVKPYQHAPTFRFP